MMATPSRNVVISVHAFEICFGVQLALSFKNMQVQKVYVLSVDFYCEFHTIDVFVDAVNECS